MILPKTLGPANYGRFEFILAAFTSIFMLLSLSLPSAFFNWISRKNSERSNNTAFSISLSWHLIILVAVGLFIVVASTLGIAGVIWPEIDNDIIWLGAILSFILFLQQLFVYFADATDSTRPLEISRMVMNIIRVLVLGSFLYFDLLSIHSFFLIQIVIAVLFIAAITKVLYNQKSFTSIKLFSRYLDSDEREFIQFSFNYVRPLVYLSIFGFFFKFFDRWFLQFVSGSAEQGFFSLASRLSFLALSITVAFTPILTHEFARAFEKNDKPLLYNLFQKIRIFLTYSSLLTCFISVLIPDIIGFFGDEYANAVLPLSIMVLFPIHQTLGQLSGAVMMANGETGLYSKISFVGTAFSFVLGYFLLAPANYLLPGMGLGATGLVIKLVLTQSIVNNVQLYFNSRTVGDSYFRWLRFQVIVIALGFSMALLATNSCRYVLNQIGIYDSSAFIVVTTIFYFSICTISIVTFNRYFGIPYFIMNYLIKIRTRLLFS